MSFYRYGLSSSDDTQLSTVLSNKLPSGSVAMGSGHRVVWVTFCLGQSGSHRDILICLTRIKII